MDFFEMVGKRRSVRRFSSAEISEKYIAMILNAALGAPSSKNCRSSSFMVIEKPELAEKISAMRDSGSSFLKYSPLIILVMGDQNLSDMWLANAAISATYVQLSAEALGMGSCWVQVEGRVREKDNPGSGTAEDYLKSFLPIPEGRRVLCAIAIGYPENTGNKAAHEDDAEQRVITL